MQYKKYTVQKFERDLGKWRASVRRTDGRLLWKGRARIRSFVTGIDATTPQRALQMALAAIDRGAFSRHPVDRRMPSGASSQKRKLVLHLIKEQHYQNPHQHSDHHSRYGER
jgi:hypothetical protein